MYFRCLCRIIIILQNAADEVFSGVNLDANDCVCIYVYVCVFVHTYIEIDR